MKKIILNILFIIIFITILIGLGYTQSLEDHQKLIYPIVRVTTDKAGGSGSIIYSGKKDDKYITLVLTNYHVIEDAISITEEWDSTLQKKIARERRSVVYVEVFKYREISIPIGTFRIEADIIIYNAQEDMALLRLRSEDQVKDVVILPPTNRQYNVLDQTIAVGCSLGFPPLPTTGILTRKNIQINSLNYHMSSSQIIYGNSGGAIFLYKTGELIGIPSMLVAAGWGTPIPHMGLFIPIERIYKWLYNNKIILQDK